jgi:hypothetical protein
MKRLPKHISNEPIMMYLYYYCHEKFSKQISNQLIMNAITSDTFEANNFHEFHQMLLVRGVEALDISPTQQVKYPFLQLLR